MRRKRRDLKSGLLRHTMRMLQTHMSIHEERDGERDEPPPVPDSASRTPLLTQVPSSTLPPTQVSSSTPPQCHESAHRSAPGANTAAVAAGVNEAGAGGAGEGEGVEVASIRARVERVVGDEAYTGEHTRVMWQCPYAEGSTEAEVFWLAVCIGDHLALLTMLKATSLQ